MSGIGRALAQLERDVATPAPGQTVRPPMPARSVGGVLTVASIAGFQPGAFMVVSSASQRSLPTHSEGRRNVFAEAGIALIAPRAGPVDTAFWGEVPNRPRWVDDEPVARTGYRGRLAARSSPS